MGGGVGGADWVLVLGNMCMRVKSDHDHASVTPTVDQLSVETAPAPAPDNTLSITDRVSAKVTWVTGRDLSRLIIKFSRSVLISYWIQSFARCRNFIYVIRIVFAVNVVCKWFNSINTFIV